MRRMFRRHIRKTLAQDVPPVLQEANFAFDKGEYGRAGELFERIAETAAARARHFFTSRQGAPASLPGRLHWECHRSNVDSNCSPNAGSFRDCSRPGRG